MACTYEHSSCFLIFDFGILGMSDGVSPGADR